MSDVDDLVEKAQKQLDEHKEWLAAEIGKVEGPVSVPWPRQLISDQVREIKLRVARTNGRVVSVVYEYPDELYAFLRSEVAPQHLRDTLIGGNVVDPNKPTYTAKRVADDV
jgi:hypothetical protein